MGSDFTTLNAGCHGPVPRETRNFSFHDLPRYHIVCDHESWVSALAAAIRLLWTAAGLHVHFHTITSMDW
jgi:hypothetical protein